VRATPASREKPARRLVGLTVLATRRRHMLCDEGVAATRSAVSSVNCIVPAKGGLRTEQVGRQMSGQKFKLAFCSFSLIPSAHGFTQKTPQGKNQPA